MKKTALLILCTSIGGCTNAGALPPATNSDYQVNPTYGAPAPAAEASSSAIYELLARLEQLQSEVQQLRGLVEEQAHTISDLERKQTNMYSDLDERIQFLTSGAQPGQQASAEAAQTGADTSQAQVDAASVAAAAAPAQQTVPTEAAASVSETTQQQTTDESNAVETTEAVASKLSEQERYQQAYETLRNGHNAQAIKMFEALYADYPSGQYGDNAQYWLGEAYKINRDLDKARVAFNKVIDQYPNSSKVPDALLKLGYIEFEQQNIAKARDYFTRITASYPGTTAAHLAAKKLAIMPR